jgi:hypothetical protein
MWLCGLIARILREQKMIEVASYLLLGVITSYHVGNSLMNDGLGNNSGNVQNGTYGLEAIAHSYGHDYKLAMHIDASQSLTSIWETPGGVGEGGVDVKREPYGGYDNALVYKWDHVLLEPYIGEDVTLGTDKTAIAGFIDLTRQNPANQNTIFYVYQVWPRQSWYSGSTYSTYWLGSSPNDESTRTTPRREFYENLMSWAQDTYAPEGILVREVPVGEVWHRVSLAIQSGNITGITMANLYRDDLHASGPLGRYLAAVTTYATLFQTDVTNLVPPSQFGTTYPPSLYAALNKIIWEVVTSDPHTGIADFNDDGYVSSADLAVWQSAYGMNANGDSNGDGVTDGRDFLNWQRNYGGEPPAQPLVSAIQVPEPAAVVLIAVMLGCWYGLSRRCGGISC